MNTTITPLCTVILNNENTSKNTSPKNLWNTFIIHREFLLTYKSACGRPKGSSTMDILIIVSHKEHYPFFKQFINYVESNVDYAINGYCGHKHFNNFSTINYCFLFDNQKVIQQMNKIKEQFPENEISFVRIIYYD